MQSATSRVDELVSRGREAACLPETLREIIAASRGERSSAADVAVVCKADLALTGRLLALVNSKLLGCRHPIKSVVQAVAILGVNRVRNFAIASWLTDRLADLEETLPTRRYWKHAYSAAEIARAISTGAGDIHGEDAYLAGLLHDVGLAFLCGLEPETYARAAADADSERGVGDSLEAACGVRHGEYAAELLADWELPAVVLDGVRDHEVRFESGAPGDHASRRVAEMVRVADDICSYFGWGLDGRRQGGSMVLTLPPWLEREPAELLEQSAALSKDAQELQRLLAILPGPRMPFC